MRIVEFASAAEQLALWKLVSDNVWAAINKQAKDEAEQKALKKAQAKTAPKSKGIAMPQPKFVPPPPKLPTPQLSASKPIATSAMPAPPQSQQSSGVARNVQPKEPNYSKQQIDTQQVLGNQKTADKTRKTGVLAK